MKIGSSDTKKVQEYFAKQKDILAVYLYGSFAKGTTHKRSDMDFAVLFDGTVNLYQRLGKLNSELYDLKLPAEPEVRDLNLNYSPVYLMNVIQGELIYAKNEQKRVNFEVDAMNIFRDTEYLRKLKYKYMSNRLKEGTYGHKLLHY